MALATQCPHCYTSFRVANDQLKLYAGMVRCGACKQTFNGIEHLIPPGSTPKQAPVPEASSATIDAPDEASIETSAVQESAPAADTPPEPSADTSTNDELGLESNLRALLQEIKVRQREDDVASDEAEQSTATPTAQAAQNEIALNEDHTAEDAVLHLEIIETPEEPSAAVPKPYAKALTSSIDFDLDEDQTYLTKAVAPPKLPLEASAIDDIRSLETAIESELNLYDDDKDSDTSDTQKQDAAANNRFANISGEGLTIANLTSDIPETSQAEAPPKSQAESHPKADTPAPTTENETDETPDFVLRAQRHQRYGKWTSLALSLGVLIGLVAALAQSTYFFRNVIAAEYPQTKPHLLRLCQLAKCDIKLPAQRSQLEISGSELQIVTNEPLVNELNFQIQNKGKSAQTWPHLELILKDIRGKTILQKAIPPAVYLDNKAQLATGIPGNSESAHKLNFELAIPKASSYTVELFYP